MKGKECKKKNSHPNDPVPINDVFFLYSAFDGIVQDDQALLAGEDICFLRGKKIKLPIA